MSSIARTATILLLLTGVAGAQLAALAPGHGNPSDEPVRVHKVTIHPAAEPTPALKWRLTYSVLDNEAGNAAVHYLTVLSLAETIKDEAVDEIDKLLEIPPDGDFPVDRARRALEPFGNVLRRCALAGRTRRCDWQTPIRHEGIATLLPSLTAFRSIAKALALRTQMHIAAGEYQAAVEDLRIGYAMADHLAEGETLIQGLVGLAISGLMHARVEQLTQAPGAPNLYWALAGLERELPDLRTGLNSEMHWVFLSVPELAELERLELSIEGWRDLLDKVFGQLNPAAVDVKAEVNATVLGWAILAYPQARQDLLDRGYDAEAVEAMPVAKAILLSSLHHYRIARDKQFKWFLLPYAQARFGQERTGRPGGASADIRSGFPFSILLPSLRRAYYVQARSERQLAVLQILHGLRAWAAENGRLPDALGAMAPTTPAPADPVTGKAFGYRLVDGKARLRLVGVEGEETQIYEITLGGAETKGD
jgi:hypothetical protein